MKIHTGKNPYHCALCGKGFISRSQIKSPCLWDLCGKKLISKNHLIRQIKVWLRRIYITELSVTKDLFLGTTQRDTWIVFLGRIHISVFSVARDTFKSNAGKNPYNCGLCGEGFKCKITMKYSNLSKVYFLKTLKVPKDIGFLNFCQFYDNI